MPGSGEVIAAQTIRGTVVVTADDGSGVIGFTKSRGPTVLTVDQDVADGPSNARGDVINWYAITGHANANITGPRLASATSFSHVTSAFRLKMDDKRLTPTLAIHFKATLNGGKATISAQATITPRAGGAAAAQVSVTYNLDQAAGNRIDVTGSRTVNIANPGGIGFTEKGASAVLNKGHYIITFYVNINSQADTKADVFVDKANLSFPVH
jgi:hypothetical protein